jgi:D-3-phosphoglycerate dehydrogenase
LTDCLIVQQIAPAGVALLRDAGLVVHEAATTDLGALLPHLATVRAVVTRNHGFPAGAIAAAPMLRVIAVHGTGTDRVDRRAADARGIAVVNTPGSNAQSVAEHALGLMFASARALPAAEAALRRGDWGFRDRGRPMELAGKTLGLIGLGAVAKALVPLAQGIGLSVMAVSEHATPQEMSALRVQQAGSLADLLCRSDVVSLHGLPSAAPILDAARIAAMKPDARLINTARGRLVDEAALAAALQSGHLGGAALDVFAEEPLPRDSPLLRAPNLILTPHIGGMTQEARRRTALAVARAVLVALGLPEPRPTPG